MIDPVHRVCLPWIFDGSGAGRPAVHSPLRHPSRRLRFIIRATVLLLFLPAPATGRQWAKELPAAAGTEGTAVAYAKQALQGFDMKVWISNQMTIGLQSWDCQSWECMPGEQKIAVEYPAESGIEHVYGGGPWIGGIVNGTRRVSEAYNGDNGNKYFRPDQRHPLRERIWRTSVADSLTEPNRRGCDDDGDGLVDEDDLDGLDNDGDWDPVTDDVGADGIPDAMEVGCRGGYDPVSNPDPAFDNYEPAVTDHCHPDAYGNFRKKNDRDDYTEMNGIPDHGEPNVDEDYGAVSDNDLYTSAADDNDVPAWHFPMGIRLVQKTYAWRDPAYGAIIPFEYTFVNTGTAVVRDVYIGYFMDADVGPVHTGTPGMWNYACYFDTLRTAYVHNPVDRGSTPIGLAVLGTPKPLDELKFIFQWYNFTTVPSPGTVDSILYVYLSGEAVPDREIANCGSPTDPGDVRFLFSFGPFEEFRPGDSLRVTFGLLSGESVESGWNSLKENVERAHHLYDRMQIPGAPLPRPVPPSPALSVSRVSGGALVEWGPAAGDPDPLAYWDYASVYAETFPPDHWRRVDPPCDPGSGGFGCSSAPPCDSAGGLAGGRTFEGYRLYRSEHQGDDPRGTFVLLREHDIAGDGIGFDLGVDSVFLDTNLTFGKRYWYAVTSYSIPEMKVIAHPAADGGVRYDTLILPGYESDVSWNMTAVDVAFRASDGPGRVLVVPNPYRVDHDYTREEGGWEGGASTWSDFDRKIRFINLPRKCTIRIFTVAGDIVATLQYETPPGDPDRGELDWRLVTGSKRPLASGIYPWSVESEFGTQYGTFVVIR